MLPVRKFPPPTPRLAPKNLKEVGRKANKARKEKEQFREMADKNWKRMGTLEEFRRDQFERHNTATTFDPRPGAHPIDPRRVNSYHRPMTPMDYSKGLFMRDLLSPTMQIRG